MTEKKSPNAANLFLKGTFILTVAGLVVKVIGSLNWIILSRVLGGEGIGIYQMAFPLYLLALSISSAGIPVAISIITAEKIALQDYRGANGVFRLSLILLTFTGMALSLLLFFGAGWLIDHRIIRDARAYYSLIALSPAIFLVTILSSFRGYLQGWQTMTPTAISQIIEQLFRVATMLIFAAALLPRGLEYAAGGASLGAGVGALAALAVLVYYYWRLKINTKHEQFSQGESRYESRYEESSISIIRRITKLSIPISLSGIMLPLVANLDLLVVPVRLEDAGYSVEQATELFGYLTGMAVPLVNLATILTASLATSLVPAISKAYSLGEKQQILQRTAGAMRLANLTAVPFSVLLWILAEPILSVVYHAPRAADITKVLAIGVFLLGIHQVTTGVLQGLGRTTIPVINMGVSAVAKVFLNWTLTAIPAFGIQGAAWATLADIGLAAVLNLYFVYRFTGFHIDIGETLKYAVAAVVMGAVIYLSYNWLLLVTGNELFAMALAILGGGVVYGGILLATGGLNRRDIERIPLIGIFLKKS
ncbi:MAG TPA: polysaccharide biosynthesis protein [Methylomusa anaerophila]|uniref:Stage V sporulation protein B n=1 Tax=Methylomusa anaerophila TaxID=1930071 RepID=A0A348AM11_9FIRM|nr:polysaccharide biosynthesis protein [Methylomusa anaerophila]BBB92109.1 stage V sporulation protein B [Methylomusa anaerophila]HML87877.1 polysaccharide biosynthesis protein [Methylomusa anaerophila]